MTRAIFLIALFLVLPLLSLGQETAYAAVVINEILPKPSVETEEWIELYNNDPAPVSLTGWMLENLQGEAKTYTIPGGIVIPGNGFWAFNRTETGINLYDEGDTVKLFNNSAQAVDSQSYPSILGYNTSMGRSSDGAGGWATCTTWTKNLPNKCPLPTSTPTPTATPVPTRTATPAPTIVAPTSMPTVPHSAAPTSIFAAANQPAQSQVLGITGSSMPPHDSKESKTRRLLGVISLCIAMLSAAGLVVQAIRRRARHTVKNDSIL